MMKGSCCDDCRIAHRMLHRDVQKTGPAVEHAGQGARLTAELLTDDGHGDGGGEGRQLVLQLRQLAQVHRRQQIRAGR